MAILEKCESGPGARGDAPSDEGSNNYEKAAESLDREFLQMINEISDYMKSPHSPSKRAMLERRADSLVLQAENGADVEGVWLKELGRALKDLRA